jgi:NAD(P)-dependent dehydrogenase (short-subunit alcohol dehydrogenase family)
MEVPAMRVVVIGGTGTIGSEVVKLLSTRHDVLACTRTKGVAVDITSADSILRFFEALGPLDALVCAAGEATFKPLSGMSVADFTYGLNAKLMGQVNLVRIGTPYIRDDGSITLTSGVTARQPIPGAAGYGLVNSGIEGFVRAAALDLDRGIRINAVSPQWVDASLVKYGMDPAWGVPAAVVAHGYAESVEGSRTGTVIDAGWNYDWRAGSVAVSGAGPTNDSAVAV